MYGLAPLTRSSFIGGRLRDSAVEMGNSETGLTSLYLCHLLSAYTHLGCWKDTARRAVPQIEGSDPRIRGNYVRRGDAINKCYQVARQRKMVIFAVQNGGWCAAAGNLNGYRKYGKASNCKNGKGGPWANDVYRITNPIKPALPKGIFTVPPPFPFKSF